MSKVFDNHLAREEAKQAVDPRAKDRSETECCGAQQEVSVPIEEQLKRANQRIAQLGGEVNALYDMLVTLENKVIAHNHIDNVVVLPMQYSNNKTTAIRRF